MTERRQPNMRQPAKVRVRTYEGKPALEIVTVAEEYSQGEICELVVLTCDQARELADALQAVADQGLKPTPEVARPYDPVFRPRGPDLNLAGLPDYPVGTSRRGIP